MHNVVILASENHKLQVANEKQLQKQKRSRKQLPYIGSLIVKEGHQLLQTTQEVVEVVGEAAQQEHSTPPKCTPLRCSECHVVRHRRNQCLQQPR